MTTSKIDFQSFDAANYFPSLDGVRAICVFLVMFNHVHATVPPWIIGWLGVDVFFVLSGFLITTLLVRERDRTGRVSLKAFYVRRAFRIVPVYLFTILLYAASVRLTHDPIRVEQFDKALPWLLSFTQEYAPEGAGRGLGHAWTLAIEEKYYIFWPLLLMTLYPFRTWAIALLAAIFVAVVLLPHMYARSYGGLLIGSGLAIALSLHIRLRFFRRLFSVSDIYPCIFLIGTYALSGLNSKLVLWFSLAVAWVIACLVLRPGAVRRFLESSVLIFIGRRSYAIYLIHVLVLNCVSRISATVLPDNAVIVVIVAYLACIAFASLIYIIIERPCIRLAKLLSAKFVDVSTNRRSGAERSLDPPIS